VSSCTTGDCVAPAVTAQPSSWQGVFSLMLGTFALVASEFLPASLLTRMASDLRVSEGAAGQAVTATAVMAGVAALTAPVLSRGLDRRAVLGVFGVLLVASNAIVSLAPGLPMLLLGRLLLGVAIGGFWSLAASVVSRLVPLEAAPKAMSIIMIGVSAATVCAAPAGALMGELWGWRAVFAVASGLGVAALVTQRMCLPVMPPMSFVSIRDMLKATRSPPVRVGLITSVLMFGGHFAGFTYVRPFLEGAAALSAPMLSGVLLAFGVAGFAGNLAGSMGVARSLSATAILAPLLIALSTVTMAAFAPVTRVSVPMTALWGLAFGAVPIAAQTWMMRAAPDQLESVGGVFIAVIQASIVLGSIAGGMLVDNVGTRAPLLFASLLAALASIVFWQFGARDGRR
jgi:predicted MFS family arabinose efflux permease